MVYVIIILRRLSPATVIFFRSTTESKNFDKIIRTVEPGEIGRRQFKEIRSYVICKER